MTAPTPNYQDAVKAIIGQLRGVVFIPNSVYLQLITYRSFKQNYKNRAMIKRLKR